MSDRALRMAGGAAIVFVVLVLISVFSGGSPPAADDAADKIRTYFVDHRSGLLLGNLLGLMGIPFVVWFAVVLRHVVRGDATANALGTASLAGLLITAPMAMTGGAIASGAIYVDGMANTLSDDTVRLVYEAQSLAFAATSAGIVTFTLAAALAVRRTGALPAYIMWLGFVAAAANVVTMFSTIGSGASALGLVGVLSFALFILVSGITLAVGKATPTT